MAKRALRRKKRKTFKVKDHPLKLNSAFFCKVNSVLSLRHKLAQSDPLSSDFLKSSNSTPKLRRVPMQKKYPQFIVLFEFSKVANKPKSNLFEWFSPLAM